MFSFDLITNSIFLNIENPFYTKAFLFAAWLFNPIQCIFLVGFTSFFLYKRYGIKTVYMFISTVLFTFCLVQFIKILTGVHRPINGLIVETGNSFPSAHTAVATAYFLMLLHFLKRTANKKLRILHTFFCVLSATFVGVSRVYLGVHWVSDVMAGYIVGGLAVYTSVKVWRYFDKSL